MLRKILKRIGARVPGPGSRPAGQRRDPEQKRPQRDAPHVGAARTVGVEVLVIDASVELEQARDWIERQTCWRLGVVSLDSSGAERWRLDRPAEGATEHPVARAEFFVLCESGLPEIDPAQIEGALLIARAETLDGVVLTEGIDALASMPPVDFRDALDRRFWPYSLWASAAFAWQDGRLVPRVGTSPLIKYLPCGGVTRPADVSAAVDARGFGQYLCEQEGRRVSYNARSCERISSDPVPSDPVAGGLGVRSASASSRHVLVTTPFLATGGAERTLFETLGELTADFEFTIVTLAPHQQELGDRRTDFRQITPRIFSFGDWVHPDAMIEMLLALIDSRSVETLYNANGTTLFYQFAPRLKQARPDLRVVDHLYDHRVGYIESYGPELLDSIDLCVAENHRIRDKLLEDHGWRSEQVEVIWPCGRSLDAFPPAEERPAVRARARRILAAEDDSTVVILTAARMHEQKRPLDLVELAARLRDTPVRFVIVGGGPLEGDVDRAIERHGLDNITRLDFRDDIPELIVGADVGCLVSDYEGLPVFMLECFQAGRPFLGTAVGEMGAVLASSGAGMVVAEPGDLDALEKAVRELCKPATRQALSERARQVAPEFSVEACAARYGSAFRGRTFPERQEQQPGP